MYFLKGLFLFQENTQSVRVSESDSGIGSSASGSGSGCGVGARYVSPRSEHGLRRNASSGVSEGSRHIDDSIVRFAMFSPVNPLISNAFS